MADFFTDIEVLRNGDSAGNGMVLGLTDPQGRRIHTVAVPQESHSHTGPTWAYIFENDGLTLIDPGADASFHLLQSGMALFGRRPADIERVIITHGHADHDGGVARIIETSGAALWAHDIYQPLLPFDPRDLQLAPSSPIKAAMWDTARANGFRPSNSDERNRYMASRSTHRVQHHITPGETQGSLSYMHAPGHSPDEICAVLHTGPGNSPDAGSDADANANAIVFTGDHVLPEISPHPTMKTGYTDAIRRSLPAHYHNPDQSYGLLTYLRSLQRVVELGPQVAVLPAHRLYNNHKFNFQTTQRAADLIRFHARRLGRILVTAGPEPQPLEDVTRRTFERRKLEGGNFFAALTEVVAHIELLEDTGDLELTADHRLRRTGRENYQELLRAL